MPKIGHLVVPANGRWSVRKVGAVRASGLFDTQEEAIERGRELARTQKSELYIFGRDGRIRTRNSYTDDQAVKGA